MSSEYIFRRAIIRLNFPKISYFDLAKGAFKTNVQILISIVKNYVVKPLNDFSLCFLEARCIFKKLQFHVYNEAKIKFYFPSRKINQLKIINLTFTVDVYVFFANFTAGENSPTLQTRAKHTTRSLINIYNFFYDAI